jgi:hypothetical protein
LTYYLFASAMGIFLLLFTGYIVCRKKTTRPSTLLY